MWKPSHSHTAQHVQWYGHACYTSVIFLHVTKQGVLTVLQCNRNHWGEIAGKPSQVEGDCQSCQDSRWRYRSPLCPVRRITLTTLLFVNCYTFLRVSLWRSWWPIPFICVTSARGARYFMEVEAPRLLSGVGSVESSGFWLIRGVLGVRAVALCTGGGCCRLLWCWAGCGRW